MTSYLDFGLEKLRECALPPDAVQDRRYGRPETRGLD